VSQPQSLFRQEAIEYRAQRQWGEVIILQPLSSRILFWAILAVIALVVTFLTLAQYARKETVIGYLAPTAGVVRVVAPRPGTISAVHVAEGETVKAGQSLLSIAVDQTTADGKNVDAAVLDYLTRQRTLLTEQITLLEKRAEAERSRLTTQIAGIEREIVHLDGQIQVQRERVELLGGLASSIKGLRTNGYVSDTEYKRRREIHLEQQQNLGALNQQLDTRQVQLNESKSTLEQLPAATAEKIQNVRSQLLEIEQRIAEIEGRRAYVVRAPVAGRVATLQAILGHAPDPRQVQLSILPNESLWQAELFVPTRAIGFVRPGQDVRILYDAFPYQRFGVYGGRVVQVAQTILSSGDASGPVTLKEPSYRVTVSLNRQDITAYGEVRPLQADMLLKADIILDLRPIILWLLDPLLSVRL
jgi:membrane fusion protein